MPESTGVVYVVPVPRDVPPTFAEYQFIVPSVAVAPRVTVPASHRDAGEVVETEGTAFTVRVIVFELAGLPVKQARFDVRTQLIILPFVKDEPVNTGLSDPASTPLTFH